MYIYYDKQGILREVITDSVIRNGDNLTDAIYICFENDQEDVSIYTAVSITFNKTSVVRMESREEVKQMVPDGDYKYFKPYKKYWFWKYSIKLTDYVEGLNYAVVKYYTTPISPSLRPEDDPATPTKAQGVITFNVADDHIINDPVITQSQFDYLIAYLSLEDKDSIILLDELPEDGIVGKVYCIRTTGVLYKYVEGEWEPLSYELEDTETNINKKNILDNSSEHYPTTHAVVDALQHKADLGNDGKIVSSQLPSYIDEVINITTLDIVATSVYDLGTGRDNGTQLLCLNANQTDPASLLLAPAEDWAKGFIAKYYDPSGAPTSWEYLSTLSSGKIYIVIDTNKTYRYTMGVTNHLVEISASLALGETSSTAFAGNRGLALENAMEHKVEDTQVSSTPTENKIPKYLSSGRLKAGEPVENDDVVRKSELDDKQDQLTAGANVSIINNVISASGGTTVEYVVITPDSATSGTLTNEQFNLLAGNRTNKIILANEIYELNDDQHESGYQVYSHVGHDSSNNYYIKCITLTLSTQSWVLSSTQVGGGKALYEHIIKIDSESSSTSNYYTITLTIINEDPNSYANNEREFIKYLYNSNYRSFSNSMNCSGQYNSVENGILTLGMVYGVYAESSSASIFYIAYNKTIIEIVDGALSTTFAYNTNSVSMSRFHLRKDIVKKIL